MIYNNMELYNVQEIIESKINKGCNIIRIPNEIRLKLNEKAQQIAFCSAGCEIRFNMKEDSVELTLMREDSPSKSDYGMVEVFYGSFQANFLNSPQIISKEETIIKIVRPDNIENLQKMTKEYGLPFDPSLVRIILPYGAKLRIIDIKGKISPPDNNQVPSKKYLAYGSSITFGSTAVSPSGTYAMRTAQLLKADLINLGFAGTAHLDEALADYIAENNEWDFATFEMGINVINDWSIERFEEKVDYFISRTACSNKNRWIFCIDLFTSYMDINNDPKVKAFREVIYNKVKELKLPKLVYISGQDILKSTYGLTSDLLHPAAIGMEEMAKNLSNIIKQYLYS